MTPMKEKTEAAASFLKGLASPHRMAILCALSDGEKSVGDLMAETGIPQTSMSQHLGKLKDEGLVSFRRDHRTLYYFIQDQAVHDIMAVLYNRFCSKGENA